MNVEDCQIFPLRSASSAIDLSQARLGQFLRFPTVRNPPVIEPHAPQRALPPDRAHHCARRTW
jgi:hypothetical protein